MLFTLNLKLTVMAPFLTKSSEIGAFGVDAPMLRNANGKCCFPRKLIKGCLRQAWTELHQADSTFQPDIEKLLGRKSEYEAGASSSVEPHRALLVFDELVAVENRKAETLFRISIDRERRASCPAARTARRLSLIRRTTSSYPTAKTTPRDLLCWPRSLWQPAM